MSIPREGFKFEIMRSLRNMWFKIMGLQRNWMNLGYDSTEYTPGGEQNNTEWESMVVNHEPGTRVLDDIGPPTSAAILIR